MNKTKTATTQKPVPTIHKNFRLWDFKTLDIAMDDDDAGEADDSDDSGGKKYKARPVKEFVVWMMGVNENGETVSLFVRDVLPFFYIRVCETWNSAQTDRLKVYIEKTVPRSIHSLEFVYKKELYGFQGDREHPFLKISFHNYQFFQSVRRMWFEKPKPNDNALNVGGKYNAPKRRIFKFENATLKLYESTIPPLLKCFHIYDISPSGWVSVALKKMKTSNIKQTYSTFEYECSIRDIKPNKTKENLIPYKIVSFDIEANSSHGDFPVPIKSYKRLVSNAIDQFAYQMSHIKKNKKLAYKLFCDILYTAFEIRKCIEMVDVVYPQKPVVGADEMDFYIGLLLRPLADDDDADNADIKQRKTAMTIEMMFEEGRRGGGGDGEGGEGGDVDCDVDGGDGGDVDVDGGDVDEVCGDIDEMLVDDVDGSEDADADNVVLYDVCAGANGANGDIGNKKNTTHNTDYLITTTILDVFLDDTKTRDEKLTLLNTHFTCILPKLKGDEVTFIGSTFRRHGENAPYLNHCFVLGEECDPIENVVVECVPTEREMLIKWTKLIQKENPDMFLGYNIFMFDWEFMFRRAQEHKCVGQFLCLSKIKPEYTQRYAPPQRYNNNKRGGGGGGDDYMAMDIAEQQQLEKTEIVLASGPYDLHYPNTFGRLQLDLYVYFRRNYNLSSYKLDDVACQYISDDIQYVGYDAETDAISIYSKNLMGLQIGDYIHLEQVGFSSNYYRGGQKFQIDNILYDVVAGGKAHNVIVVRGYGELLREYVAEAEGGDADDDAPRKVLPKMKIKWGMSKDDVSPKDIFRLTKEGPKGKSIVAKYCIQDCNLVQHLLNKIDVITEYVEMSNICNVPISFLIFRGQGIKLTSCMSKHCGEHNTLMPDLDKVANSDGYEGAIVLEPKCKMYGNNPVACVDFSSLYPSIAKGYNLCPSSKVWTVEYDLEGNIKAETGVKNPRTGQYIYDNLPDYDYFDTEFDTYQYRRSKPTAKAVKTKIGIKKCRWAKHKNGEEAIIPSIIGDFLKKRNETKVLMENASDDPFMYNIYDKRQLAFKVSANSIYGQMGASTSTFFEKDVAASITAMGRQMIIFTKTVVEEVYGDTLAEVSVSVSSTPPATDNAPQKNTVQCSAEYVYGDSVADYTPVYCRRSGGGDGMFSISTIEELATLYGNDNWVMCREIGKQEKEYCEMPDDIETWTDKGWTRLYRIIRHALAPHKKMVRILTHTGLVDVTDDHSLLTRSGEAISPKEVKIGTELLHHTLPITQPPPMATTTPESEKELLKMGALYDDDDTHDGYENNIEYIMGECIERRAVFWRGLCLYNTNCRRHNEIDGACEISVKTQRMASRLFWLATSLGYNVSISTTAVGLYIITATTTTTPNNKQQQPPTNPYAIKQITDITKQYGMRAPHAHTNDTTRFVYDLTTENHHFSAGIGQMVVHNTDSVFFTFNLSNPITKEPIRGKEALAITIELAQKVAKYVSTFLPPPMKLAYEKTLMEFIILSKKRYIGELYEYDLNKFKVKFMGLSLKRRDICDFSKDVYGDVISTFMSPNLSVPDKINQSVITLNRYMEDLIDGKMDIGKLTLTKALRSDYKNPTQIAHNVLAERIGRRDAGKKPKPGDRIQFAFIVPPTHTDTGIPLSAKPLLGEKIETLDYIAENNVTLDYMYYITNQLMKPLQQLFALALVDILKTKNKHSLIKQFERELKPFSASLEEYNKQREKIATKHIKTLLFDPFLTKVNNKLKGNRNIMEFFTRA